MTDIHDLRRMAVEINGPANPHIHLTDRVVGQVLGRDSQVQDVIYAVK